MVVFVNDMTLIYNVKKNNAFVVWHDGLEDFSFPIFPFEESKSIEEFRDTVGKIMLLM